MRKLFVALVSIGALVAIPATASATVHPLITEHTIVDNGGAGAGIREAAVGEDYTTAEGSGSDFAPIDQGSWDGYTVYLWKNADNGQCIQDSNGVFVAAGCNATMASEQFYYNGTQLINRLSDSCLSAQGTGSGKELFTGYCSPTSYENLWATEPVS
jgi:hypothetical protein